MNFDVLFPQFTPQLWLIYLPAFIFSACQDSQDCNGCEDQIQVQRGPGGRPVCHLHHADHLHAGSLATDTLHEVRRSGIRQGKPCIHSPYRKHVQRRSSYKRHADTEIESCEGYGSQLDKPGRPKAFKLCELP